MSQTELNVESGKQHRCDNCGWEGATEKLDPICDISERLTPGGVVPSGQCPECQALAYQLEDPREF